MSKINHHKSILRKMAHKNTSTHTPYTNLYIDLRNHQFLKLYMVFVTSYDTQHFSTKKEILHALKHCFELFFHS